MAYDFLKYWGFYLGGFVFIFLLIFLFVSVLEKEWRAVKRIFPLFLLPSIFIVPFFINTEYAYIVNALTFVFVVFGSILFLIKRPFPEFEPEIVNEKIDERTTIFSRAFELDKDNEKYLSFYQEYPEMKNVDDNFRKLPGLLSSNSLYYNELFFEEAKMFMLKIGEFTEKINYFPKNIDVTIDPGKLTEEINKKAKQMGAQSCGFTKLQDYHLYSIKGRGDEYGKKVVNKHHYAIAITVEMNVKRVKYAPFSPVIAESAFQYYNVAKIADNIAQFLTEKGYEAKTHIDANYDVICPLVARDAGLGDIGRMGILMDNKTGPRLRIAVITTNAEVITNRYKTNNSLQYFCKVCRKCAIACPSKAINVDNLDYTGKVRYRVNHEKCFSYWCKAGTDCARCMSVCPYSHPNNFFHRFVKFFIARNPYSVKLALMADNYFYGNPPKPKNIDS